MLSHVMENCPSCTNPVSPKAMTCPKCGHPFKKPTSGCAWLALIGGICFILIIIGSGAFNSPLGSSSPKPENYAIPVGWEFVRAGLKSPTTADFGRISTHQKYSIEGKPDTWEVRGHVDSQNSFGAMIRSNYTCQVEYVSGDASYVANWKLLDLKIE